MKLSIEALANLEEALGLYFEREDLPASLEPPIILPLSISCVGPSLLVVSGQEAINALGQMGFVEVRQRGSYVKLRDQRGRIVIVPKHRELAKGTLSAILRQSGVSVSEFIDLL